MSKLKIEMMATAAEFTRASNWRDVSVKLLGSTQPDQNPPHVFATIELLSGADSIEQEQFFEKGPSSELAPWSTGIKKLFKVTIEEVEWPESGISGTAR